MIWENLVDSKTVELTANDNTVYSFIWLETKQGPLVVEIPPKVLGLIDDIPPCQTSLSAGADFGSVSRAVLAEPST